jgi:uncharacterized Fe-S center protein
MKKITFLSKGDIYSFSEILSQNIKDFYPPGSRIGVKVHFGEPGNCFALTPAFIKQTVQGLKNVGLHPFLFDSPVSYTSPRNTVNGYRQVIKEKGITQESMGCPIIISDEGITAIFNNLEYSICKPLLNSDGILVLTHVKGHTCTGFGGSIKNIGMGGMSKKTKKMIHDSGKPRYQEGCTECKECVINCPLGNIRLKDKRPYFDQSWCCGCSNCVYVCKNRCITPQKEVFDQGLVAGVKLALDRYPRVFYVNVLMNIMRLCDCVSNPGPSLARDIGILFGDDLVAIEKASLDMIIKDMGEDVFLKEHKKSPLVHIKIAEDLGLGHLEYTLKEHHA